MQKHYHFSEIQSNNQSQILFQWKLKALHLFDFLSLFKTINFISQYIFILQNLSRELRLNV